MAKSRRRSESSEAPLEPSTGEESGRTENHFLSEDEESAVEDSSVGEVGTGAEDWWSAQPGHDWAEPITPTADAELAIPKVETRADVYFSGYTSLFSLNRALQVLAKDKLSGALRAFWDGEPIQLLTQDGAILFATTRDPELYCAELPALLANVDSEIVAGARARQSETGTPFFLTLARQESIAREPAMELVQHYGQRLFSQLWTAQRVWIMFEKNAEFLTEATDIPAEADVDDWVLETLRLISNLDQPIAFDPTSIPAYTKDGYERVQKLKLTSDEAQFASQFNGARSVQQIAKNLRLDLKSAHLMLFRFLSLEIVECWPASTAPKRERRSVLQRFKRLVGRG